MPSVDMFVQRCLTSDSPLVCSFICQASLQGRTDSITGRNVLNRCFQYLVNIDDVMTLASRPHDIVKFTVQPDDITAIADWLM
jgi:hypothetical protein